MSPGVDLENRAFRFGPEYAWKRDDALRAVDALEQAHLAIFAGATWLVAGGAVLAVVPRAEGIPLIEHWSCERRRAEAWNAYVTRAAADARRAIQSIPPPRSVDLPEGAVVHYNLRWMSEDELDDVLANQASRARR
jgi:hypothetical protein